MAKSPVPVRLLKLCRNALNPIAGLPAIPSAFVIVSPVPTVIERLVSVVESVLTCMPAGLLSSDCAAPVRTIDRVDPAPLSVSDKPDPTVR
jgi:hypothetical protein